MSQAKVDKYKEEKYNRKQIIQKQKRNRLIAQVVGVIVCIAIVGWIGYSAYGSINKNIASTPTEIDLSAIQGYIGGLTATTAE